VKVVIPAAGMGSRFLPVTKSQPKEMLPVVDRPIIQYVVEEAVAAGADDILIVTGRGKRALEDHFDYLAEWNVPGRQFPELEALEHLSGKVRLHFVRQREPRGLADAIGIARAHTGSEPFGVLLGDTIHLCHVPLLRQLWLRYEKLAAPVVAIEQVPLEKVRNYGIIAGPEIEPGLFRCESLVEKPKPENAPSRYAITGAYVLTPAIFPAIDRTPIGFNGEQQFTDALAILAAEGPVYATTFEGIRYDVGDRYLWIKTNVEFALRHPEYGPRLRKLLTELLAAPINPS